MNNETRNYKIIQMIKPSITNFYNNFLIHPVKLFLQYY